MPQGLPVVPEEALDEPAYPEFALPEGSDFSDYEVGEEFKVAAVIKLKSPTTACLVSVDGAPVTVAEADEAPEEAAMFADMASRAQEQGLM